MSSNDDLRFTETDPTLADQKPDPAAAKRALAICLGTMSLQRINDWSQNLEAMHGGASPEFRAFARAFIDAAGADLIPLVKSLLGQCGSDEAKFLLVAVLGESRKPESFPLLREFLSGSPGPQASASALYSIGMVRSGEGLEYLKNWFTSVKPADKGFLLGPALAAVGQHGADAVDFMLAQARLRRDNNMPSVSDVVGMIRGPSAVDALRGILESDPDWDLKRGAAIALGFSNDPKVLMGLGESDPGYAGIALLAARDVPDVWGQYSILRSEIAMSLLDRGGVPSGNWRKDSGYLTLAILVSPDKSRKLYESVTGSCPEETTDDRVSWLKSLVAAFADQPDLDARIERLAKESGMSVFDVTRSINMGVQRGALQGRLMGSTPVIEGMLRRAVNPSANPFEADYELHTVLRSGVSGWEISRILLEAWKSGTANRDNLMSGVQQAAFRLQPPVAPLGCAQPVEFLATIIREDGNLEHRVRAAYSYLMSGETGAGDAGVMRAIPELIQAAELDMTKTQRTAMWLGSVISGYYARAGTSADIPRLQSMTASFPLPPNWNADTRAAFERDLARDLRRAIDAIRLRSN